jgi:hypothetical protein
VKSLAPFVILVVLTVAFANSASSHSIARITGSVSSISSNSVTLTGAREFPHGVTVELQRSTLFLEDGKAVLWTDVKRGAEVDLAVSVNGDLLSALNLSFENPPGF